MINNVVSQNLNILDENKMLMSFNSVVDLIRYFVDLRLKKFEELKKFKIGYYRELLDITYAKTWAITNFNFNVKNVFKSRSEMKKYIKAQWKSNAFPSHRHVDVVLNLKTYHYTEEYLAILKKERDALANEFDYWMEVTKDKLFLTRIKEWKDV